LCNFFSALQQTFRLIGIPISCTGYLMFIHNNEKKEYLHCD
jgi:hypothetical protein